jgi:hypothetical protein
MGTVDELDKVPDGHNPRGKKDPGRSPANYRLAAVCVNTIFGVGLYSIMYWGSFFAIQTFNGSDVEPAHDILLTASAVGLGLYWFRHGRIFNYLSDAAKRYTLDRKDGCSNG